MNRILILLLFSLLGPGASNGQAVRDIYFHLYTDSLKKGMHNYINIDGKMTDGSWRPLTNRELNFTTDYGSFEGNDLVLPAYPTVNKVFVTAILKSDPSKKLQRSIWIKQQPDPPLPAYDPVGESRWRRKR